jgi:adenine C2-methylase RlmN of 23S rRNA A2503 and tRNA A37
MAPKRNAESLTLKSIWDETLVSEVLENKKHRARMWKWLISNPTKDICDIPFSTWLVKTSASQSLLKDFVKFTTTIVQQNESVRGDTTKLLLELQDGHRVETVVMKHASRTTVCVSSQIGCQMGCKYVYLYMFFPLNFINNKSYLFKGFARQAPWESLGT